MSWISTNNLRRFADNLFHGKLSFNGNVTHNGAVEFNGGVKVNTVEAEFNAPVFFTGPAMYKGNEVATKADVAANSITADDALSSTSTNAIQNRVVQQEFTSVRSAIPTKISQLTNDSSYTTTGYVRSAIASARASIESKIPTKLSQLTNDSGYLTEHQSLDGYVKTVNNTAPDHNGNVTIAVSGGGGANTNTANTWTATQTFGDIVFTGLEKCDWYTAVDDSVKPTKSRALIMKSSSGVLTIDMSELAKQTSNDWHNAIPFKFIILCSSGPFTLKIDGISNLYINNVTITDDMILEGFVFGGTSSTYAFISATSLNINVSGEIS